MINPTLTITIDGPGVTEALAISAPFPKLEIYRDEFFQPRRKLDGDFHVRGEARERLAYWRGLGFKQVKYTFSAGGEAVISGVMQTTGMDDPFRLHLVVRQVSNDFYTTIEARKNEKINVMGVPSIGAAVAIPKAGAQVEWMELSQNKADAYSRVTVGPTSITVNLTSPTPGTDQWLMAVDGNNVYDVGFISFTQGGFDTGWRPWGPQTFKVTSLSPLLLDVKTTYGRRFVWVVDGVSGPSGYVDSGEELGAEGALLRKWVAPLYTDASDWDSHAVLAGAIGGDGLGGDPKIYIMPSYQTVLPAYAPEPFTRFRRLYDVCAYVLAQIGLPTPPAEAYLGQVFSRETDILIDGLTNVLPNEFGNEKEFPQTRGLVSWASLQRFLWQKFNVFLKVDATGASFQKMAQFPLKAIDFTLQTKNRLRNGRAAERAIKYLQSEGPGSNFAFANTVFDYINIVSDKSVNVGEQTFILDIADTRENGDAYSDTNVEQFVVLACFYDAVASVWRVVEAQDPVTQTTVLNGVFGFPYLAQNVWLDNTDDVATVFGVALPGLEVGYVHENEEVPVALGRASELEINSLYTLSGGRTAMLKSATMTFDGKAAVCVFLSKP